MGFWSAIGEIISNINWEPQDSGQVRAMPNTPDTGIFQLEVRDTNGYWIPAGSIPYSNGLLSSMRTLQDRYSGRAVRAVDQHGRIVDMLN